MLRPAAPMFTSTSAAPRQDSTVYTGWALFFADTVYTPYRFQYAHIVQKPKARRGERGGGREDERRECMFSRRRRRWRFLLANTRARLIINDENWTFIYYRTAYVRT